MKEKEEEEEKEEEQEEEDEDKPHRGRALQGIPDPGQQLDVDRAQCSSVVPKPPGLRPSVVKETHTCGRADLAGGMRWVSCS